MTIEKRIGAMIDDVRRRHAVDPRTAVFEIAIEEDAGKLTVLGATSEPAAAEELHRRLATLDGSLQIEDRLVRLPHEVEPERAHALVTAAVAPMLAGPMVAEIHLTQALLGHRLTVLRRRGRWLQCRAPDGYIGWVHRGYVQRLDEVGARAWEIGAGGEPCMSLGAEVLGANGSVIAQLPWGARVVQTSDGGVKLPDGTIGEARGELLRILEQPERFPATGEAIVRTAERWMAAPYLWGGTTPGGVDCSGLVQAVFRTHGIELPRDSDQQARLGEPVEPEPDFSNMRAGDLLFFAEVPERITHVTISTGGAGIIHSSLGNGGVRRNDLQGATHFEEELKDLFVCARRVLSEG